MRNRYILSLIAVFGINMAGFSQGNTCADPILINPEDGGCTSPGYDNTGFTSIGDPIPSCWGDNPDNSVWFQFTATATQVTVNTNFTTLPGYITDTEVALFSGTCGSLTELNCNEDIGPGNTMAGLTQYSLTIGVTYYIMVDGAEGQTGDFNICVENLANPSPPEPGKDCNDATLICDQSSTTYNPLASGFGSSSETGTCLTFGEHQSTLITFTAATTGLLEFIIQPIGASEYDWVLFDISGGCPIQNGDELAGGCNYNYTGSSGSATGMGPAPAGADAGEFNPSVTVTAGDSYALLVSNFDDDNVGFDLSWGGTTTFEGPEAEFTATPVSGCAPLNVNFTNTSTPSIGDTLVYSWDFGDGSPATSTIDPNYTFTNGGSYTVTLSAQGSAACVVRDTIVIDITSPAASFVPSVVCNGNVTDFTNTSINSTSYQWDFTSDGSIDDATTNPSFLFPGGGTFSTTLIATDGVTGCKDTTVTDVSVASPIFNITPLAPVICSGDTVGISSSITPNPSTYGVTFTNNNRTPIPDATRVGGNIVSGSLSSTLPVSGVVPGSISASTIASVCFTIDHTKQSDIQVVTLQNGAGTTISFSPLPLNGNGVVTHCFSSTDLAAFIGQNPNQTWTLYIEDNIEKVKGQLNSGDLVSWSISMNTANTITSFGWSPTTNMVSSGSLTPSVFPTTDVYYVLTATDATGCQGSDSLFVDVNLQESAAFSLSDFCVGASNNATISGTTGGIFSFNPVPGDGASVNSSTGEITNENSGTTYSIQYITQGACPDTSIQTVSVSNSDNPAFSLATFCPGAANNATVTGTPGGTFSFNPAPGDGATINSSTGEISSAISGTTYFVEYLTPAGPCQSSAIQSVTVTGLDDASFTTSTFCEGAANSVTITGVGGGTFSFDVAPGDGATINSSTGVISNSTAGANYTIRYTTSASACQNSSTQSVSVTPLDDASFSLTDYCPGAVNAATVSGLTGGTFSFNPTPIGPGINPSTGEVTGGIEGSTYGIDYTTNGACPNTTNQTVTVLSVDDASFTYPSFCFGTTRTANLLGTAGGIYTFNPDPADGSTINASNGTITNGVAGETYTVQYTTSGACPDTFMNTTTVIPLDTPTFILTPFCEGAANAAVLTGTTGGSFQFDPNPGDGSSVDAATGELFNEIAGTTYFIQYTTALPGCQDSLTQSVDVLNDDDPSFTIAPFCPGAEDTATVTGLAGGIFSFAPDPGDGSTIDSSTGLISNAVANSTYTVQYTTNGACPDSTTQQVFITSEDDASFVLSSFCADSANAAQVTGVGGGTFSFETTPADGAGIDGTTGEITGSTSGATYSVIYTTPAGVCQSSDTMSVSVGIQDDADFTAEDFCISDSNEVVAVDSNGYFTFLNIVLDGAEIDSTTGYISSAVAGTYYNVRYTTLGTCPDSDTVIVFAESAVANFTPSDESGDAPLTVSFDNLGIDTIAYAWDFGNGDTSNDYEPSVTYDAEGNYTVRLMATSDLGCKDTTIFTEIIVTESCTFSIPTAFTPDGDGINDTWEVMCMDKEEEGKVAVLNRWGATVYESKGGSDYKTWNGNGPSGNELPSASYFYVVEVGGEKHTGSITLIR